MSVTMDDVAARAGVSRAAVSMALRNSPKVSAARREQILQVAAELGYRPNINASRLARTRTGTIGVVFSDLHNALYAEMLDGLDAALRGEPEQLLLASGFHDPDRERAAVEAFLAHRVDGLALLGSQLPASEIQQLASEVPTVIAGRRVEGVDWVTVDDAVGAPWLPNTSSPSATGASPTSTEDTAPAPRSAASSSSRRCASTAWRAGQSSWPGITPKAKDARPPWNCCQHDGRPSAIFAANDASALGVLSAARSLGIAVPESLSVVGFDNTTIAQSDFVGLSTVDYARHQIGERTLALLKARIADSNSPPRNITLTPGLIARITTAVPSGM